MDKIDWIITIIVAITIGAIIWMFTFGFSRIVFELFWLLFLADVVYEETN